jgi:hypothetical protein
MAVALTIARLRKALSDVLLNPGGTAHIWGPVSAVVALLGLVATRRLLRSSRRLRLPENEPVLKSIGVSLLSHDASQECSIGFTRRSVVVVTPAGEVLHLVPIADIDDVFVLTSEGSTRTRIILTAGKSKPTGRSVTVATSVQERVSAILTTLEAARRNIQDGGVILYHETTDEMSFIASVLLQASNSQSFLCAIASDRLTSLGADVSFWREAVHGMLGICVEQLRRVETSPQDWPVSAVLLRPFDLMPMPKPEVIAAAIKDMRQLVEKQEKADEKEAMLFGALIMLRCLAGLLDAISLQRALSDADVAWIAAQAEVCLQAVLLVVFIFVLICFCMFMSLLSFLSAFLVFVLPLFHVFAICLSSCFHSTLVCFRFSWPLFQQSFDNHVVCLLFHILFVKAHSAAS